MTQNQNTLIDPLDTQDQPLFEIPGMTAEEHDQIAAVAVLDAVRHQAVMAAQDVEVSARLGRPETTLPSELYLVSRDGTCNTVRYDEKANIWSVSDESPTVDGKPRPSLSIDANTGKASFVAKEAGQSIDKDADASSLLAMTQKINDSVVVPAALYAKAKRMYGGAPTKKRDEKAILADLNQASVKQTSTDFQPVPFAAKAPNRETFRNRISRRTVGAVALLGIGAGIATGALSAQTSENVPAAIAPVEAAPQPINTIDNNPANLEQAQKAETAKEAVVASAQTIVKDMMRDGSGAEVYLPDHPRPQDVFANNYGNKRLMIGKDLEVGTKDDKVYGPELYAGIDPDTGKMELFSVGETPDGKFNSMNIELTLAPDNPALKAAQSRDLTPADFAAAVASADLIKAATAEYETDKDLKGTVTVSELDGVPNAVTGSEQDGLSTNSPDTLQLRWLGKTTQLLDQAPHGRR